MTSPTTAAPNAARHPTAEKILRALTTQSDATAADLAASTGLGRSTVTSHLAQLEKRGDAFRKSGGREDGRKLPDRWRIASVARRESASGPSRLKPGQLSELVLQYTRTLDADESVGPVAVAGALGRSSGAVANCLSKLVLSGHLKQVSDRPRRYSVAQGRTAITAPAEPESSAPALA